MKPRYGPVFDAILREEKASASTPEVTRNAKGEVWRYDPTRKAGQRRKFLGWVDYMAEPRPPEWPGAGWWAGAGIQCFVTGLDSMGEAVVVLLEAHGIDVAEWKP